jgi:hypothetical protein
MPELKKGTKVVACPGGRWEEMKIIRVHDDGTYDLMPVGADSFLDEWESVTRQEISVDDRKRWTKTFTRLRGAREGLGFEDARKALEAIGIGVNAEAMKKFWTEFCAKELNEKKDAESRLLDEEQAYLFFLRGGFGALAFERKFEPERALYKLYWNSIRMGGREPDDVGRAIGLADALSALGLADAEDDPKQVKALDAFEKAQKLKLPATLRQLWSKESVLAAICGGHCNNPEPVAAQDWVLRQDKEAREATGRAYAVRIMTPHQGDHAWWAAFDRGDQDASIWLSFEEDAPPVVRVAFSLPFFFWDLRETGRCWELKEGEDEAGEDE